jgi:hypothetical protein
MNKTCTNCGKTATGKQQITKTFYKDCHTKDGLRSWCKDCYKEAMRPRAHARHEKLQATDPEYRAAKSDRSRRWFHEHKHDPVYRAKRRIRQRAYARRRKK